MLDAVDRYVEFLGKHKIQFGEAAARLRVRRQTEWNWRLRRTAPSEPVRQDLAAWMTELGDPPIAPEDWGYTDNRKASPLDEPTSDDSEASCQDPSQGQKKTQAAS